MTTTTTYDDFTRATLKAHTEWLTSLSRPRPRRHHLFKRSH